MVHLTAYVDGGTEWRSFLKGCVPPLVKSLQEKYQGVAYGLTTNSALACIGKLYTFMERNLGFFGSDRFFPKFSKYILFDTQEKGALYQILSSILRYREQTNFDHLSLDRLSTNEMKDLYKYIYLTLEKKQLLDSFIIYISPELPPDVQRTLQLKLIHLRAVVTNNPEEARYHIVPWGNKWIPPIPVAFREPRPMTDGSRVSGPGNRQPKPGADTSMTELWARPLGEAFGPANSRRVTVHLRGLPHSYDTTFPARQCTKMRARQLGIDIAQGLDMSFPDTSQDRTVCMPPRWVEDSWRFGEWTDPLDYIPAPLEMTTQEEMDAGTQKEAEKLRRRAERHEKEERRKRRALDSERGADSQGGRYRHTTASPAAASPRGAVSAPTRRKRPNVVSMNITVGGKRIARWQVSRQAVSMVLQGRHPNAVDDLDQIAPAELRLDTEEEDPQGVEVAGAHPIALSVALQVAAEPPAPTPSPPRWFRPGVVSPHEREVLGTLLGGTLEDEEAYITARDVMVAAWSARSSVYLNYTAVKHVISGEAGTLLKTFDAIESMGLINRDVHPSTRPAPLTVPLLAEGGWIYRSDPLPAGEKTRQDQEHVDVCMEHSTHESEPSADEAATDTTTAAATTAVPPPGASSQVVPYHCDVCQQDCTLCRFHCIRRADFDLCPRCFDQREGFKGLSPSDFIKLEFGCTTDSSRAKGSLPAWSHPETLLLLEAVSKLGSSNWQEISTHVGTDKQPDECLRHFLSLAHSDQIIREALRTQDPRAAEQPLLPPKYQLHPSVFPQESSVPRQALYMALALPGEAAVAARNASIRVCRDAAGMSEDDPSDPRLEALAGMSACLGCGLARLDVLAQREEARGLELLLSAAKDHMRTLEELNTYT
eukprot:gnl/Dysnectes_brevis/5572_a8075_331.p1 GENE.gnl/Dysnectes_brevis/5572_a8075_331~~gnl/Dysnectes_brevis/5572_a8075_331.p1  ORF type:complete len:880 (+),score=170.51 gnl/Dysnectes_brevis/5572_a8075_331:23-2662(+)